MRFRPVFSSLVLLLSLGSGSALAQSGRVVFIRGAPGTGGFLEGGSDEQLSDINNFSTSGGNHGFGELRQVLEGEGFSVEQVIESTTGSPVDFAALDLSSVSVLVLGSNNQTYSAADVQAVTSYVQAGGGLLVISDANWGSNWGKAPTSDQPFLDPFGLIVNQDTSTYQSSAASGDHLVPIDPILKGRDLAASTMDDVLTFDGEGVSPFTVGQVPAGVQVQILARAEGNIHVNDSMGSGSFRAPGPQDGCLVVAYSGLGAVVGHFDRNTFFNDNGAGTNINRFDNTQYAKNLFHFLTGPVPQPYGDPKLNSQGGEARVVAAQNPLEIKLSAYGALPGQATYFVVGSARDAMPFFGGELLVGGNLFRLTLGSTDGQGVWSDSLDVPPLTFAETFTFQQVYRDPADPTGYGLSSAVDVLRLP